MSAILYENVANKLMMMLMLTYSIIAVTELQRRKSTTPLTSLCQYLLLNLNI